MTSEPTMDHRYLLKFLVMSAASFFVGSIHGVLQVIKPVRAWLDSIGSPYGGPGHMIDPLAHAHINLIGGVTLLCIAVTYYLLTIILKRPLYSNRLSNWSFWGASVGIYSFYTVLMVGGTIEGNMLLNRDPNLETFHHSYVAPLIAITATIMGSGLWIFMANVFLTVRQGRRR